MEIHVCSKNEFKVGLFTHAPVIIFRSDQNYLRITRILKCLGEFGYEHLKANFVKFMLYEGMVEGTLSNVIDSCVKYWIGVLKNDQDRKAMFDYYDELVTAEKAMEESGVSKNKGDEEGESKEGATGGNGSDSDNGCTLEYDVDLMEDGDVKRKKKYSKEVKYRRSNEHEMSEADENDAAESQDMKHWNEQQMACDAIEDEADEDSDSNKSKGEKKSGKQYTNMSL